MAPIPHVHKKKKDDADTIRRYMSGGSAGVPDLTGYAQESWVGDNFVTKEFFRSMFKAYDSHGVEILPNNDGEEPSVIDNIKAMVGFWTNEYISALGQGSGGGGGGGSTSLAGLTDVAINPQTLAGGQALIYNGTTHKWENGSAVINMASVWSALAASTNEQINASHLSAALQGFATETWVSQNYISIAYFDRLFRAYNGNTLVSHNDETSTIDNIKAMFGFWTEQYLSALGNSGGGSVSLTLANMGDVSLNNLADGQILVYDATEGKWVNTSASIVGNYLPLTGGTMTGNITLGTGVSIRCASGFLLGYRPSGSNIVSSTQWGVGVLNSQGVIRSDASDLLHWRGSAASGQHYAILDESNVKTINGESIYGSGNIVVGGGGSAYLPLAGGTMTGNIRLEQGVAISSDGYSLLVYRPSNNSTISNTQWGVGATNSQGVIRSNASDLLHWRGTVASGQTYAILDEYNAVGILDDSFLPLTGGTLTGRLTINSGVLNVTGETSYGQGIRIHPFNGTSSIFFGCDANTGMSAGMFGITHSTTGLRIRGQASTSSTSLVDYLTVAYGGNVGIGTTSPSYKLHVNGTLGAGNTSVANLESEGYVSALSDIRKKDVVEYMDGLTIEQIASMPIIKFTWKDRPEEGLQVGSVAQEWEKILPQSVHKSKNDYLSFSYGVAALVGTISNSRELMKHDARLSRIEKLLNINIA